MTAKQFKQARIQLGYTQAKLAMALELSRMTISRYEAGTWEIPLAVEMALDQLGAGQLPMLGLVAAGAPIEPITQAELVAVLREPFTEQPGADRYAEPAPTDFTHDYRTFCGT